MDSQISNTKWEFCYTRRMTYQKVRLYYLGITRGLAEKIGFENIEEIGGEMNPSEAYNVAIETDEKGELLPLKVTFDNPDRSDGEMYLDYDRLEETRLFWESLHKKESAEENN